jgi:hypothetical protein
MFDQTRKPGRGSAPDCLCPALQPRASAPRLPGRRRRSGTTTAASSRTKQAGGSGSTVRHVSTTFGHRGHRGSKRFELTSLRVPADLPGFTRSVYERDYALITPESRVWAAHPAWQVAARPHLPAASRRARRRRAEPCACRRARLGRPALRWLLCSVLPHARQAPNGRAVHLQAEGHHRPPDLQGLWRQLRHVHGQPAGGGPGGGSGDRRREVREQLA